MKNPSLDLLIPCYNPNENWELNICKCLSTLQTSLPETKISVVLVNDGSSKELNPSALTYLKTNISSFQFIETIKNNGKGHALRLAAEKANSDLQILIDVDFPYKNESILKVYDSLVEEKSDLVLGYRNESYYNKTPITRKIISKTLRFILKHLIRLPVSDTQCGLKGFNQLGKQLLLETKINTYLFDLELVLLSRKNKLKISAVHVFLKEGIVFTRMKGSILIKEALNFFRLMKIK